MATRLYVVRIVVGSVDRAYLVDAGTPAAARLHVARKHIEANVASGKEVAKLMAQGVTMESAVDEPAAQQQNLPQATE